MHVGLAVMAALVVRRHDPRAGTLLLGSAALIWWSTLSIRQHWTADGLVAAAMAVTADHLWFGRRALPPEALRPLPRRWHLTWIGAYVGAVLVLMSGWFLGWMPLELLPPNAPRW
jgi:hypothetical protein